MKNFIGYFSYYMVLNTAVFTALSSMYLMLNYSLSASLKLGLIYGFLTSIIVSTFFAIVTLSKKSVKTYAVKQQELREKEKSQYGNSLENSITQNKTIRAVKESKGSKNIVNRQNQITLFLLMNKYLAFDILVQIVIENNIWKINARDKERNTLTISTEKQDIYISIETLTENTSQIEIKTNNIDESIKNLIKYIKEKEHSFLQY